MIPYFVAINDDNEIFDMGSNVSLLKQKYPDLTMGKCSRSMAIMFLVDGKSFDYFQVEEVDGVYYLIQELEAKRQKQILIKSMNQLMDTMGEILEVNE